MVHGRFGAGQHNLVIEKHRAMLEHCEIGIDEIARAVKAIEPARDGRLFRFGAEMPFAGHHSAVTALAELLGQRRHIGQDRAAVAGQAAIPRHVPHAGLVRIQPRQQRRPRRTTPSGIIKLRKPQTVGCEFIQHGCFNLSAVTAEIRKAGIICHNDDDVGLFLVSSKQ